VHANFEFFLRVLICSLHDARAQSKWEKSVVVVSILREKVSGNNEKKQENISFSWDFYISGFCFNAD